MLLAAVDRFMGNSLQSTTLERLGEYNWQAFGGLTPDKVNDPTDMERGFHARNTVDTLRKLADFMAGIRGRRKAMLFVSEGIDYDIHDVFNNRSASMIIDSVRDAIGAATRANVSIYGIDPRGLTALGDDLIEVESFPDDQKLGINLSGMQNALRLSQDSLRWLSDETGGFAVVNRNDYRTARITCWASIRRTTSAMAASASSKCGSSGRGCGSVHAGDTSRRVAVPPRRKHRRTRRS